MTDMLLIIFTFVLQPGQMPFFQFIVAFLAAGFLGSFHRAGSLVLFWSIQAKDLL